MLRNNKEKRIYNTNRKYGAKFALNQVKYERRVAEWCDEVGCYSFYTDNKNVAHTYTDPNGYKIIFKIETDDYPYWEDLGARGYSAVIEDRPNRRPEFAQHGEFTRFSGGVIEFYTSVGRNSSLYAVLPEKWIRQFYNPKLGRHEAYTKMVEGARNAVESDVEIYLGDNDWVSIGVVVESPSGEEIFEDWLGGCDLKYATSGKAFLENGFFESAKEEIAKHWKNEEWKEHCFMYGNFSKEMVHV